MSGHTEVEIEGYYYLQVGDQFFMGCTRCGGTGHYSFDGQSSICYNCGNNASAKLGALVGDRATTEKHAHRRAVAKARRDAKRDAEAQERLAKMEAARALVPAPVQAFLTEAYENGDHSSFVNDIASKFNNYDSMVKWGGLSTKVIAAVERIMADRISQVAAKADLGPVATGRRLVEGVVQSVKVYEGDYGTTYKFLIVEPSGHKVFGSAPKAIWDAMQAEKQAGVEDSYVYVEKDDFVGRTVALTATVEASRDDDTFGIYSRPTKASLV